MSRIARAVPLVLAACLLARAGDAQPVRAAPSPPPGTPGIPVAPGTRFVWEPSHWVWNGQQYVFHEGRYLAERPRDTEFVPGHWAPRDGAWVWVPDHWR